MSKSLLFLVCLLLTNVCFAGVNLSKTRVIIDSVNGYSGSVQVNNHGDEEVLIQTWLDDGVSKVGHDQILVSPPIRKLGGDRTAILKINLTGLMDNIDSFTSEKVYFLNVKVIPQRSDTSNKLLISTNSRIKVLIRPEGLKGYNSVKSITQNLEVSHENNYFLLANNSPFSMNFERIFSDNGELLGGGIILPGEKMKVTGHFSNSINVKLINDYGARKTIDLSVEKR